MYKLLFKDHKVGVDLWLSKKSLFESFFGDFYEFIKSHNGEEDLKKHSIKSLDDFLKFAYWYAYGMENCYGMGFAFHKYYLTVMEGGTLDEQPESTFIGYCFKNGKYIDFLNFLVTFFAWWRNDEGCTCFDPYNHADESFNSSWALLVDTCKLFYFTAETVFHWQSFRVKYALDNIPGVILSKYKENYDGKLPKIRVAGYQFDGWFDEKDIPADKSKEQVLFAHLTRKDTYNYWEKEEKTIKKVYDPNYKKVDPA